MRAVGEVAEFAPSLAVDIVRGAKIAGLEQAADLGEKVGAFGELWRAGSAEVALVVEKNPLVGESPELHRAEGSVAEW